MLFINRLNNINSQIDSYQEQIAELQRRVTELQAHAQEVQGAESAAESALVQVRTALDMLTAICPEDIATFKIAIANLFDAPLQLTASTDDAAPTTTEPVAPNPPVDEVIDLEPTSVIDEQPEIPTNGNGHNGNGKGDASDFIPVATITNGKVSVEELKKLKRPILVKLANNYSIEDFNNKTRDKLAELLAGKVSRDVLDRTLFTSNLK